MTSIRVHHKAV